MAAREQVTLIRTTTVISCCPLNTGVDHGMQVKQELLQAVKGAQYVQALDLCQQCKTVPTAGPKKALQRQGMLMVLKVIPLPPVLSLQPRDATAQQILAVLQEKIQLGELAAFEASACTALHA